MYHLSACKKSLFKSIKKISKYLKVSLYIFEKKNLRGKNTDRGINDFRISGQSLIKENCHNSRTNGNIDIKFGSLTKIGKKKFDDGVMLKNCDVIATFPSYGKFGAIRKPDSHMHSL